MDRVRIGRAVRVARRRRGYRQVDVAIKARVCQQTVSKVESGDLGGLTLDTLTAVGEAVGVELALEARYRGAELARLLDDRHARVVGAVASQLRPLGWELLIEHSFNHFGERGSVDILAWHPEFRALLVIEVKTEIADLQDLLASHDRKVRLMPEIVARERGWRPLVVGRVLVLPEAPSLRRAVARHAAVFDSALPARSREVRRWVARPTTSIRGIWFL